MAAPFTKRQGEYLAFIHHYTTLHRQPPAETDIQAYFRVSSAAVHTMIVALENRGLIEKTPYQARSIRLRISPQMLPSLDGSESGSAQSASKASFEATYPYIADWIAQGGQVELGHEPNTDTHVRAVTAGGVLWSGGHRHVTVDENLRALNSGLQELKED